MEHSKVETEKLGRLSKLVEDNSSKENVGASEKLFLLRHEAEKEKRELAYVKQ